MPTSLRLRVLSRHARRLVRGPATLGTAAYRTEIIEPATSADITPSIYLPGQIEKIISASKATTLPYQIDVATSLKALHAASIAYHIRDATLFDGSFYSGRLRHMCADVGGAAKSEIKYFDDAAVLSSLVGTRFFGHWLTDDCPKYLLAERYAPPLSLRHPYEDLKQYANYFDQHWTSTDCARIKRLVVFQDHGQGKDRQARYEILHNRLAANFPKPTNSSVVYLRRGNTGIARLIKNEEDILVELTKRGFVVADLSNDGLDAIIQKLMSARVVVSIEGSQVAHCCAAMKQNTGLVILSLPTVFGAVHRGWAEARHIRYGFVVGSVAEGGFTYDSSDILLTVDKMLSALN
ncbi:MAG TPA: glycosyltransferase family 61 protein [Pseudolabrys sp.]|nr:glycosyltransferase family 61 protein [Pseudolabrys sp.]